MATRKEIKKQSSVKSKQSSSTPFSTPSTKQSRKSMQTFSLQSSKIMPETESMSLRDTLIELIQQDSVSLPRLKSSAKISSLDGEEDLLIEGKDLGESTSVEKKELGLKVTFLKTLLSSRKGFRFEVDLFNGGTLTTGVAGKYGAVLGGSTAASGFPVNSIQNASGWSSVTGIFDEFFIKSVDIIYQPNNAFAGDLQVSATASNLQSSMISIFGTWHTNPIYADSGTAFYQCLGSPLHKITHTSKSWRFVWKNIVKFSWELPAISATPASGWCQVNDISSYGGFVGAYLPFATNASPSSVLYPASTTLGTVVIKYRVCFRARA